jgi:site-specific DNA-methyltransferase (adenine-specific)
VGECIDIAPHVLHIGDCLDVMRGMPDASVDAVVTDPPYGLSFMGKAWDYDVPTVEVWAECLRILKPGGHLLAFAGTRTQHRMAVRIEDAGFEIRDMIAWVYGSGFSKSYNLRRAGVCSCADGGRVACRVSIQIAYGALGAALSGRGACPRCGKIKKEYEGWGTALKPALEPITVARRPLDGTVAANFAKWGVGGLNVDGCRVEGGAKWQKTGHKHDIRGGKMHAGTSERRRTDLPAFSQGSSAGRWPANLIHDGSPEVVGLFPVGAGGRNPSGAKVNANADGEARPRNTYAGPWGEIAGKPGYNEGGSAARFFYCAKASKGDREDGCEGMKARPVNRYGEQGQGPLPQQTPRVTQSNRNHHPTVKPTALMRYLVRLACPAGGVVLDPFAGSGSTGRGAALEGRRAILIEREPTYAAIAAARIRAAMAQPDLFAHAEEPEE